MDMIQGAIEAGLANITKAAQDILYIYIYVLRPQRRMEGWLDKQGGKSSGVEGKPVVWYVIFYNMVIPVKYVDDDNTVSEI